MINIINVIIKGFALTAMVVFLAMATMSICYGIYLYFPRKRKFPTIHELQKVCKKLGTELEFRHGRPVISPEMAKLIKSPLKPEKDL